MDHSINKMASQTLCRTIALILAAVSAAQAASIERRQDSSDQYLQNPATNLCIAKGDTDYGTGQIDVLLGSCNPADYSPNPVVPLAYLPSQYLISGTYCLQSPAAGPITGTPLVLGSCFTNSPGALWTRITPTVWQNGFGLCIDSTADTHDVIQSICNTASSSQAFTFIQMANPTTSSPTTTQAPTPTTFDRLELCVDWIVLSGSSCPSGKTLTTSPTLMCDPNIAGNCQSTCCVPYSPPPTPPPQVQSCGSWAVQYGGSPNACGAGAYYTGYSTYCAADGTNCEGLCCTPYPTSQSCGSWCVKEGGSPNCCGAGYAYTADDTTFCPSDNSGCQSSCCAPVVY